MFTKGFTKVAKFTGTASIVPRSLAKMTGAPAQEVFGKPVRQFAKRGRYGLVPLTDVGKHGAR